MDRARLRALWLHLPCIGSLMAALLLGVGPAVAEPKASLESEVRELRGKVAELETSRGEALRQLEELRALVSTLQGQIAEVREAPPLSIARDLGHRGPSVVPAIARGRDAQGGLVLAQTDDFGTETPELEDGGRVGTDRADDRQATAERIILERQGGVLVPPGQLVIEPALQYTNTGNSLLNVSGFFPFPGLVIGRIDTASIDRDVWVNSLEARYGLHRRVELSLSVPYIFRSDRFERALGTEDESVDRVSDNGIGDIQFGVFSQILYQQKWWPDTVFNFLVRAPTGRNPFDVSGDDELPFGTGTWGIQSGITMVRQLDPAVVFGSLRYLWDIADQFDGQDVDLGDAFEYTAGLAFSLNERLAFTTSLSHSIVGRSKLNGDKIAGTDLNVVRLFLGGSYRMSPVITTNLNIGIGLTEDAPDFSIELSWPLRLPYELPHL